jgi:hypothetical protein
MCRPHSCYRGALGYVRIGRIKTPVCRSVLMTSSRRSQSPGVSPTAAAYTSRRNREMSRSSKPASESSGPTNSASPSTATQSHSDLKRRVVRGRWGPVGICARLLLDSLPQAVQQQHEHEREPDPEHPGRQAAPVGNQVVTGDPYLARHDASSLRRRAPACASPEIGTSCAGPGMAWADQINDKVS